MRLTRRRLTLAGIAVVAIGMALVLARIAWANVTVTTATGGSSISADNTGSATWTTLGNIVITENSNTDFSSGLGITLVLNVPSGFQFHAGTGSVSVASGFNLSAASISVTASAATITYSTSASNKGPDVMTISGLQVQPTAGTPLASGNIVSSCSSTGVIAGVTCNSTNFGTLTEVAGAINKLSITSVNGGSNPTAGSTFPVVVKTTDQFGNPVNTGPAVGFSLSVVSGGGTLGGTTTGTIAAGTNNTTINPSYTKAESGVVLRATQTSGSPPALGTGDSASFTVNPGAATKLVFTSSTASVASGSTKTLTAAVEDANSNVVTSDNATVVVFSQTAGAGSAPSKIRS